MGTDALRRAWARGHDALGRVPIGPAAALAVALGVLAVWRYGLVAQDYVLFVIGLVALGVVGACLLATTTAAAWIAWSYRRRALAAPLERECGYVARTGFSIPNPWFIPLVTVHWTWASPAANVKLVRGFWRIEERVTPLRRGEFDRIVRDVEIGDVFGLTGWRFHCTEQGRVRFGPSRGRLKDFAAVNGMTGGDAMAHPLGSPEGDRVDLRNYAQGDPIRLVLWKVYARSRRLVVRTPERALSPVRRTIAYLVAGAGDEPAAGAAKAAITSGGLGAEWLLGADGTIGGVDTVEAALDAIVRSASVPEAQGAAGLAAFLQVDGPIGRKAIVFVPARPGPWVERVVAASRITGPTAPLDLVVCTDGVVTPRARWLDRLLRTDPPLDPSPAVPASAGELRQVLRALTKANARVVVVDRQAGKVFGDAHLDRIVGRIAGAA